MLGTELRSVRRFVAECNENLRGGVAVDVDYVVGGGDVLR